MPKPKQLPKEFKLTAVETKEVDVVIRPEQITKIVEDGKIPAISCVRGAENEFLNNLGLHHNCYIKDEDNQWYQSGMGNDRPYRIREATTFEKDVMDSFQQLRHALYTHRIGGKEDNDEFY